MATVVIVNLPAQQYTPRSVTFNPSIASGTRKVVLTCSRVAWPAGDVGSIDVMMPDGSDGPSCTFAGGTVPDKNGVVAPVSGMVLERADGSELPAGVYSVTVKVLQTITTAIRVEAS